MARGGIAAAYEQLRGRLAIAPPRSPLRRPVLVAVGVRRVSLPPFAYYYMKSSPNSVPDQEPIGIVISRGTHHEKAPKVFAYVWGPAPELPEDKAGRQVA